MKTILVTGHMGLTGRACVEHFSKKGWDVVGIDNNSRARFFGTEKQEALEGCRNYFIDIGDQGPLGVIFKNYNFDAIIHTAAQPSHDYSTDHPLEDFDTNARATLVLLEAAWWYAPDAPFVFCSTDKVYGENMGFEHRGKVLQPDELETRYSFPWPFREDLGLDFAGDRSLFGCSKAAADMYVQAYAAKFGMKTACFRLGCITGKNHQGAEQHGFLAYLAKTIREGKTYTIFGNGKQVRDQIHATDVARAFDYFIQAPKVGAVYNLGGGPERSVSVLEAGNLLAEAMHKPFKKTWRKPRKGDRLWDIHDITKFKTDYPLFDYSYSLQDIIKELV